MSSNLGPRLDRLEAEAGRPGEYLTVLLRHFSEEPVTDTTPIWHAPGRVLVVHEGYEHLGEELMLSMGEAP